MYIRIRILNLNLSKITSRHALSGRSFQGRPPIIISDVKICPGVQQLFHHIIMPFRDLPAQNHPPIIIPAK